MFCFQIYEAQPLQSPVLCASKASTLSASEIAEMIVATLLPPHDIWTSYLLAVKVTGLLGLCKVCNAEILFACFLPVVSISLTMR